VPSLAVHDVTLINPRLLPQATLLQHPGRSASTEIPVRLPPKSAFDFVGNRRSASAEMAVRFRPFYTHINRGNQ
jgi:hypothetical protein